MSGNLIWKWLSQQHKTMARHEKPEFNTVSTRTRSKARLCRVLHAVAACVRQILPLHTLPKENCRSAGFSFDLKSNKKIETYTELSGTGLQLPRWACGPHLQSGDTNKDQGDITVLQTKRWTLAESYRQDERLRNIIPIHRSTENNTVVHSKCCSSQNTWPSSGCRLLLSIAT